MAAYILGFVHGIRTAVAALFLLGWGGWGDDSLRASLTWRLGIAVELAFASWGHQMICNSQMLNKSLAGTLMQFKQRPFDSTSQLRLLVVRGCHYAEPLPFRDLEVLLQIWNLKSHRVVPSWCSSRIKCQPKVEQPGARGCRVQECPESAAVLTMDLLSLQYTREGAEQLTLRNAWYELVPCLPKYSQLFLAWKRQSYYAVSMQCRLDQRNRSALRLEPSKGLRI